MLLMIFSYTERKIIKETDYSNFSLIYQKLAKVDKPISNFYLFLDSKIKKISVGLFTFTTWKEGYLQNNFTSSSCYINN